MEPCWLAPPEIIEREHDALHLWRCRIDEATGANHFDLLSPDERGRAQRFRVEHARQQFVIARAFLRMVLGRCLDRAPQDLRFDYSTNGKPFLIGEDNRQISFNLSHSENLCLIALTRSSRVGVDVEKLQSNLDYVELGRPVLSPVEMAAIEAMSPDERPKAFLERWTQKEAYLKAIGEGLGVEGTGEPDLTRWTVVNFSPDVNYVAAVAVENPSARFKYWALQA